MSSRSEALGAATVGSALNWAARRLGDASESPRLDAKVLLAHVLGVERVALHLFWRDALGDDDRDAYVALVERRERLEPVAYLVGQRAFYDVDLLVDRNVLIPRPETEHMVEVALSWAEPYWHRHLLVADVGTGSGALAVVLARHLPQAYVVAVDASRAALGVAKRNVSRYHLEERVDLVCGDLLTAFSAPFDLVVANLPYVCAGELPTLSKGVTVYEPHLALNGGDDGLDLVGRLLGSPAEWLARPGLALFEIDPRQSRAVVELARKRYPRADTSIIPDLAGWDRVVRIACPDPVDDKR